MMLHNSYMEVDKRPSPDGGYVYLPKASFKRYFSQLCIFDICLSSWSLIWEGQCQYTHPSKITRVILWAIQQSQICLRPLHLLFYSLLAWYYFDGLTSFLAIQMTSDTGRLSSGRISLRNCLILILAAMTRNCCKIWGSPSRNTCARTLTS